MNILYVAMAFSIVLVSGCAASINEYNARQHAQAGAKAGKSGEFAIARKEFARALTNARLAHANPKMVAALSYEYGRYSGMICDWVEGEKGLSEAYDLDRQNGGPAYMSLVELARRNLDRQQYGNAVEYFDRVVPELESLHADSRDPIGYAQVLDEYAASLEETGKNGLAGKFRDRAGDLRKAFPGQSAHTDRTPYGTQCRGAS